MKKTAAMILILILSLQLAACGSQETSSESTAAGGTSQIFGSLLLEDTELTPGEDFAEAYAVLGSEDDFSESVSCYAEGYDKVYTYDGFSVSTYPDEDKDIIMDVRITSDSFSLDSGLGIGSSLDDVISAYGEGYELSGSGMYKYFYSDEVYMYFFMLNGSVSYYGVALEL